MCSRFYLLKLLFSEFYVQFLFFSFSPPLSKIVVAYIWAVDFSVSYITLSISICLIVTHFGQYNNIFLLYFPFYVLYMIFEYESKAQILR